MNNSTQLPEAPGAPDPHDYFCVYDIGCQNGDCATCFFGINKNEDIYVDFNFDDPDLYCPTIL